jgi:hypothetical protein
MKKSDLLQLILPEEIFTYFELEKIKDYLNFMWCKCGAGLKRKIRKLLLFK